MKLLLEVMRKDVFEVAFLQVSAEVRYWEDAAINGAEDEAGTLIPFRNGDLWEPVIDLVAGRIVDWPEGVVADIHYKVCDQGEYWLLDADKKRIAKWSDDYVPNALLCPEVEGYGDYIIMAVDGSGAIRGWKSQTHLSDEWVAA